MESNLKITTFFRLIVVLLVLSGPAQASDKEKQAEKLIHDLILAAQSHLSGEKTPILERETAFHNVAREKIHFPVLASLVTGKYWIEMSNEQRQEFLHLFSDFFLKSYAPLLGGYPDHQVDLIRSRQYGIADVVVQTILIRPAQRPAKSEWRVREVEGTLRIVDISISGSSVGFSHRVGFHNHLQKKGIEGLLSLLRLRAEQVPTQ